MSDSMHLLLKASLLVCFLVLVLQKNLEVGETLSVDMSSVIALSSTVNVQIKYNGPMRRVVFGVTCLSYFNYLI